MVRSVSDVRRIGARVWRGEALREPNLRALYAIPSGTVLARLSVAPERTRSARLLGSAAISLGLSGPFVRAGDRSAEIFWRGASGRRYALIARRGSWPERFELHPNPAARRALSP